MIGRALRRLWQVVRQLSGDDAYERYLAHHAAHHPGKLPMSRAEFFRCRQDEKWQGINRCC